MRLAYFKNIHSHRFYLNLAIAGAILILGLVYLMQINSQVQQNYAIRNCQKEYDELESKYKKIEAEISQTQSLARLQEAVKDANMAPAKNISYLGVGRGRVVVNLPEP